MVSNSPFIQENVAYRKTVSNTKIVYDDADTVNAYAVSNAIDNHMIKIYGGIYRCSYVAGYALATRDIETIIKVMTAMRDIVNANKGDFGFLNAIKIIEESIGTNSERIRLDAESFASGCIVSVISHELGHICLHHTYSPHGGKGHRNPISRNNERSADLFASSIVETTPFAGYMIPGDLLVNIFLAWFSSEKGNIATTHPMARERAEYIYNSHDEILAEYGITKEVFDSIMPKKESEKEQRKTIAEKGYT